MSRILQGDAGVTDPTTGAHTFTSLYDLQKLHGLSMGSFICLRNQVPVSLSQGKTGSLDEGGYSVAAAKMVEQKGGTPVELGRHRGICFA